MGFGDKNYETKSIDDLAITNNANSRKVLATVASTVFIFTNYYPDAVIVTIGSTLSRTRLYRIGITNNLEAIEKDFYIYGLKNNKWYRFKKSVDYDAFLIKRKNNFL